MRLMLLSEEKISGLGRAGHFSGMRVSGTGNLEIADFLLA